MGLFQSIRPTIKYKPGKGDVVADALSKSHRKDAGDSPDNLATTIIAAIKEEVLSLSD